MSPTVFRDGSFRFFFFSREEPRVHVHVQASDGEAKFWIEPIVTLAQNHGLTKRQIRTARALVESHTDEILHAWHKHFGR